MQFFDFDEIKGRCSCLEVAKTFLGLDVDGSGRCAATWRGGDNPTSISINESGWYDHVRKEAGTVIDLVAAVRFGGSLMLAQQAIGLHLGLTPRVAAQKHLPGETPRNRYEKLIEDGYKEKARYAYTDAAGTLLHQVIRMEHPEKHKEFLQADAQGHYTVKDIDLVLYNLPGVVSSQWACVVEGEKDADTLIAWDIPATTNAGGAEKWREAYTETLAGKDIVILPDNDDAGQRHARLVAAQLKNRARSIRIITLSDVPKGDATDWKEKEGGTKEEFMKRVTAAKALDMDAIPDADESDTDPQVQAAKDANKWTFRNFVLVDEEMPNGKTKKVPKPRKLSHLVDECHKRFLGFPRKCVDTLFDHDRDSGRIFYIHKQSTLFSWIMRKSKNMVDWRQGSEFVTKEEFFEGLLAEAIRYEAISSVPDWPRRSDVYYSYGELPPPSPDHKVFEDLVKFFCPANEGYGAFLRAFLAAPLFYKYGVPRPAWIIDSEDGPGTGKTKLVFLVGHLYQNPPIEVTTHDLKYNTADLVTRLVSGTGRHARVFLLDNVIGDFKSAEYAGLVTRADITGKAPYGRGEEIRPNNLTYVITSNSANVDNDTVIRSFYIYVRRPVDCGGWLERVMAYINAFRMQIFADIIDMLEKHEASGGYAVSPVTRFSEFECRILQPMCGSFSSYADAVKLLGESRSESNIEEDHAQQIEDTIRAELAELSVNPERHSAFIHSSVLKDWLAGMDDEFQGAAPIQIIRNLAKAGLLNRIDHRKRRLYHAGRRSSGIMWTSVDYAESTLKTVDYIIVKRGKKVVSETLVTSPQNEQF